MEIKIAGRSVPVGARLYHLAWDTFGTVTGYDASGSAELTLVNQSGFRRRIYVQNGGKVNGIKLVYWHKKINLDLPIDDISALQAVVDTVSTEMLKVMGKCDG